ncbi:MAG: OmpA family protein [Myxococcales bacterium]|nr:OmpA family protein [Myxococcales bacterium]
MIRFSRRSTAVAALLSSLIALSHERTSSAQTAPQREEYFYYRHAGQQTAFDVNLFEPSTSPQSVFSLELARVPTHLTFTASLFTIYAYQPLVARVDNVTTSLVEHDFRAEIQGSLGLFQFLELGLAMPVAYTNHARALVGGDGGIEGIAPGTTAQLAGSFRAGDLRLHVKLPFLRNPLELAARVAITAPIGSIGASDACSEAMSGNASAACGGNPVTRGQAFSSSIAWTIMPQLLVSRQVGPAVLAANLGYRFRERNGLPAGGKPFVIDDEFQWGLGARVAVHRLVNVGGEINGRIGVLNAMGTTQTERGTETSINATSWPVEALVGADIHPTQALSLDVGIRRGLSGGYGSPTIGAFMGARYSVTGRTCSNGPEDYDGFEDSDYCEDPDNDADGVLDNDDRCPNDAEDRDGVIDDDGCPDPDNDADGKLDDDDRCPVEPEDYDGTADDDGCPDPDNDRDGIPDTADQCDNDPEDLDRFEDEDGCPEPGPAPVVVTRTESRLLLSQRIYFEYDSDVIRNVSFDILNEVGATLRRNPDITMLRIEGHTDSAGVAQYNLDLSFRRARAVVEYLVQRGVERNRLDFRGFGSQRLAGPDDTPDGQALNRRVEFVIVSQGAGDPAPQQTTTPAPNNPPQDRPRRRRRRAP